MQSSCSLLRCIQLPASCVLVHLSFCQKQPPPSYAIGRNHPSPAALFFFMLSPLTIKSRPSPAQLTTRMEYSLVVAQASADPHRQIKRPANERPAPSSLSRCRRTAYSSSTCECSLAASALLYLISKRPNAQNIF